MEERLRACLSRPRCYETNILYFRFRILKLEDMIKMKFAKFMFKYSNDMLPNFFNNHLANSKTYITTILDKKLEMSTFKLFSALKQGKKR